MRRGFAAALGLAALAAASPAVAEEAGVVRLRLENGLDVILKPIEGADRVAMVALFDVGADSDDRSPGFAHLMEHLAVTCAAGSTPARTAEEWARSHPAGTNAQTGYDYTVVATVFPPKDLDAELADVAARLGDLRITQADLDREVPRIGLELANMGGGIPPLGALNLAADLAVPAGTGPHGGRIEDVRGIRLEQARERWARYGPGAAWLSVAGGFDAAAAEAAIRRHLGGVPARGGKRRPVERGGPPPPSPQGDAPVESTVRASPPGSPAHVCVAIATHAYGLATQDVLPRWLVVASRLFALAPVGRPGGPTVLFAPLDRPEVLALATAVAPDETPEQAMRRLDGWIEKATAPPVTPADRRLARETFAFLLGGRTESRAERMNPYGVAFRLARSAQAGIGAGVLTKLDTLTDEDFGRVRLSRIARVTLLPKP